MLLAEPRTDVRNAILDAAGRLFQFYGYRKTTVEDVAREARMSRATIYLYFCSKEELALGWMERFHDRLLERLTQSAESDGPASERLREMLTVRVTFAFDKVHDYAASIDDLLSQLQIQLM